MRICRPWGRVEGPAGLVLEVPRDATPSFAAGRAHLPFGNGRSYGDVCLSADGVLLDTRTLDRVLAFDRERGVVRCEGGVLLGQILNLVIPLGWTLPVVPGTRHVTVGGAIANDVHGKNHHRLGTFGRHVRALELVRSDGTSRRCSPSENTDWFRATVGGLGLTGLIMWAELALRPLSSRSVDVDNLRFGELREFFDICEASDPTHEYTVAWIDGTAAGGRLGRGWFFRGNHCQGDAIVTAGREARASAFDLPEPPFSLIGRTTQRAFNAVYYRRPRAAHQSVDLFPFLFPLDRVRNWNVLYGPGGFYQFQCVVPDASAESTLAELLRTLHRHRHGSCLVVLKRFGALGSPGLLSFPRPGPTLAVDVPNRGAATRALLSDLERTVREAEGAIYPAKDRTMTAETFQAAFPRWHDVERRRDPAILSSFWRRVTE